MKLNKFTVGVIAGISVLTLAVPILAEISSAETAATTDAATVATTGTTSPGARSFTRPIPTQQQVTAMAAKDDAFLKNIDAMVTVEKSATQAHEAALTAAASITDDTQRQAAVQKANQDERTAIQSAFTANPELKSVMMPMGGGHGPGFGDRGAPGQEMDSANLASKLGITAAQLQTEMQSGKTIQQIAQEHGVTLPARTGGKHGNWMGNGSSNGISSGSTSTSTSTAQ